MLRELSIHNVAVIDALTVSFAPGLNVLTGETGAGKSILIDALQLVLGARSSEELLRSGAEEAMVEAAFDLPADPRVTTLLAGEGIAVERGEFLVLRRHLFRDGKSKAYVYGRLRLAALLRGYDGLPRGDALEGLAESCGVSAREAYKARSQGQPLTRYLG